MDSSGSERHLGETDWGITQAGRSPKQLSERNAFNISCVLHVNEESKRRRPTSKSVTILVLNGGKKIISQFGC